MTQRPPSILVPAPEDTAPATQAQRNKDDLSQQSDRLLEIDAYSSTAQLANYTYSDYDVSPELIESSQQTDFPLPTNVVATMEDNNTQMRSLRFWCVFAVILSQYSARVHIPETQVGYRTLTQPKLVFFDQSLINTVHPTITLDFHAPNLAPWLETAFFIASTASQLFSGRLSGTCGRRKWETGFCMGGIGAGGVLAMSPILTKDLIDIGVRGTYQGFINIAVGISSAAGAAVDGWITYNFGCRWTFGIQAPAALAVLAVALVLGCNLRGILGSWTHPTILSAFMSCIISLGIFICIERRAKLPLMPLKLLSTPPRAHLVFSDCFAYMGWSTMLFYAPLLFQCMKLDPTYHRCSRLAVQNIGVSLSGLFSGMMMTRTKRTIWLVIFGSAISVVGTLALSMANRQIPSLALTVFILITSFGMGLNTPAVSLAVIAASSQEDQAVMTTTLALWRRLGSAIAYQGALQKTFCLTMLAYLMSLVLVVFLKFPRLQNHKRTSGR
ncbi:MFS general substrate transporter [Pyrenochaeta sp. DS3sAY3a]|nr:MFS general substrate transporter [Pyrenochaeta sp. DS3sAY3a]